ncbi:hypothetical protein GCM10011338_26570 [Alteromonas lipolytica]|nr:hypothetical protein GCM10011338_26570 [Alteromonas lipolytica]
MKLAPKEVDDCHHWSDAKWLRVTDCHNARLQCEGFMRYTLRKSSLIQTANVPNMTEQLARMLCLRDKFTQIRNAFLTFAHAQVNVFLNAGFTYA